MPQSGDIGMGVSILSYNDGVQFGLVTDKTFVPDPKRVVDRFFPEFERLVLTVLQCPRDVPLDPATVEQQLVAFMGTRRAAGAHRSRSRGRVR